MDYSHPATPVSELPSCRKAVSLLPHGTPRDVSTRVLVETGQVLMVHGPGGAGKVFQLTGRTGFAPGRDFEELVSFHGRDDFAAGRDFVAEVCGALT